MGWNKNVMYCSYYTVIHLTVFEKLDFDALYYIAEKKFVQLLEKKL